MKCIHVSTSTTIVQDLHLANSFFSRLKGLLGTNEFKEESGLLIIPCNSVHTMGMKFAIDVIFISKNNQICHMIKAMKPNRLSKIVFASTKVLELPAGTLDRFIMSPGDKLEFLEY